MINVCIDGNYFFHKTFGVFAGYGPNIDPGKVLSSKSQQSMFIRKISTDMIAALRNLPLGGRLVFTMDSRSWRKDVEIEDGGYKSGRVKDIEVDWTIFFDLLKSFGEHLEKMGFIFSKVDGAEGDDLLLYWSEKFNSENQSCIILTGDNDMSQLVKMESSDVWTIVWTGNSKNSVLYVPPGWEQTLEAENKSEISIFNMGSTISPVKEKLKDFLKKARLEEVDRFSFIFNKILIGDKGDFVPSVWVFESAGKISKITPKSAEKIYDLFLQSEWSGKSSDELFNDDNFQSWIAPLILRIGKSVDSSENRIKVKSNFIRNLKLMWLNDSVIPEYVSLKCKLESERGMKLEKKSITLDRIKILEGTEWVSDNYHPSGFDPFENFLK